MTIKYSELSLGQIEAIVNKLGGMDGVQCFLSGSSEVVVKRHIIDTNTEPHIPDGYHLEAHRTLGQVRFGAGSISFRRIDRPGDIQVSALLSEWDAVRVANANIFWHTLNHPEDVFIKEFKKYRYVLFLGTKYTDREGKECIFAIMPSAGSDAWAAIYLDDFVNEKDAVAFVEP